MDKAGGPWIPLTLLKAHKPFQLSVYFSLSGNQALGQILKPSLGIN